MRLPSISAAQTLAPGSSGHEKRPWPTGVLRRLFPERWLEQAVERALGALEDVVVGHRGAALHRLIAMGVAQLGPGPGESGPMVDDGGCRTQLTCFPCATDHGADLCLSLCGEDVHGGGQRVERFDVLACLVGVDEPGACGRHGRSRVT